MTEKLNPREVLARLISLRNNAGGNLYLRLKLADGLLSDREWVEDPSGGGGDASRAIDRIEADCFGPEAGMSLPEMLEVLVAVPQETVWKQNRYNLRKMLDEVRERKEAARRTAPSPKAKQTEPAATKATSAFSDRDLEMDQMEGENKGLKQEVSDLKDQLKEANVKIKEQDRVIRKLRASLKKMKRVLEGLQIA